jgi:cell division initiation protein
MNIQKSFEKGAFGYKTEIVDKYLKSLEEDFNHLEKDNKEQAQKIDLLIEKVQEYRKDEDSMKDAIITAQKLCATLVAEAKQKAEEVLSEAKSKADELVRNANSEKMQSLDKLRNETITEQRNLKRLQREVSDFKSKIISSYKTHLDLLSNLPSVEEESEVEIKIEETVEKIEDNVQPVVEKSLFEYKEETFVEAETGAEETQKVEEEVVETKWKDETEDLAQTKHFSAVKTPNTSLFSNIPTTQTDSKFGELKFGKKTNND